MKKLLFIARNDILNGESSTGKKVFDEYRYFSKIFDTSLISQSGNKIILTQGMQSSVVKECKERKEVLRAINDYIKTFVKQSGVRNIYIRYPKSNPVFLGTLKELKKIGCKIIIEFPTYPYDAEIRTYGKSFRNKAIFYVDRMFRHRLKYYVYAAATFSKYSNIFGIPAFQIYNGLFVDEITVREPVDLNDIHIIAVAQMQRSHGYDRFIKGLANYYKNNKDKKIFLHLVGDGPEKDSLEKLSIEKQLTQFVVFHGYCTGEELDRLYNKCSLALETLGFHRIGINLSSSLKSREYLSKGLPIITSVDIDVVDKKFPYVLKLSSDDIPIDMEEIITFFERIYTVPQTVVVNTIREFAKEHCDMEFTLLKVKEKFNE